MKFKVSTYFLIFLLALASIFFSVALTWRFIEDKLLWLIISGILIIMVVAELIKDIRARPKTEAPVSTEVELEEGPVETELEKETGAKVERRRLITALGWLVGFFVTIYVMGYLIAIPAFAFSYVKVQGRSWLKSAVFAILLLAVLYAMFVLGLKVRLYKGLIFSL